MNNPAEKGDKEETEPGEPSSATSGDTNEAVGTSSADATGDDEAQVANQLLPPDAGTSQSASTDANAILVQQLLQQLQAANTPLPTSIAGPPAAQGVGDQALQSASNALFNAAALQLSMAAPTTNLAAALAAAPQGLPGIHNAAPLPLPTSSALGFPVQALTAAQNPTAVNSANINAINMLLASMMVPGSSNLPAAPQAAPTATIPLLFQPTASASPQNSNYLEGLLQAMLQAQQGHQLQQQQPQIYTTSSGLQIAPTQAAALAVTSNPMGAPYPSVAAPAGSSAMLQWAVPPPATASAAAAAPNTMGVPSFSPHPSAVLATTSSVDAAAAALMTGRNPVCLYLDYDPNALNQFQCLLRQQIEAFETPLHQARSSQGRNTPVVAGQVGIRCKWCFEGHRRIRPRKGAVYYSKRLDGIYQVAQNLAKTHYLNEDETSCPVIPKDIKARLRSLHSTTKRGSGGKAYWTDGLKALGVYEDGQTLRFRPLHEIMRSHQKAEQAESVGAASKTDDGDGGDPKEGGAESGDGDGDVLI